MVLKLNHRLPASDCEEEKELLIVIIEPTERTLQSYELNYFIEQRVILLTSSDS